MSPAPVQPKIYHIVHVDRLASILADGCLWSDAVIAAQARPGSTIGMASIKHRRLHENYLASHPDLTVGGCVPFLPALDHAVFDPHGQPSGVGLSRRPATHRSSGGGSASHGRLGRSQRPPLGVHAFQRRIALLRGSMRSRSARRGRLGRRQGDPLEWRCGFSIREGREASRIPIGGALSVEFGRTYRSSFFRDDLPGGGQSACGRRTSPACGDATNMVLLSQEAPT